MSAIFGEVLTFGQGQGKEVRLRVTGDEFYARYETLDGYAALSDRDKDQFCYAILHQGALISSGVPVTEPPPVGIPRHLRDSEAVRRQRFAARRVTPERAMRALRASSGAALTLGPSQGLLEGRRLTTGTVRGLTILVEFQDVRTTVSTADLDAMLNGANYQRNGNYCSAREYFRIVSTGKLDYANSVVGPFRLSRNRSYYVQNLLVKEALDLAVASGVNLKDFDSRNEGLVDALNILYAGQTVYDGELWPHNYSLKLQYGSVSTDLYLLTSAGRSADDLSIGTFCHENGHLLCRFPDMYDYGVAEREGDNIKSAGIGSYCLMGSGNHLDFGRTPAPVCAYLRDLAGWCDNEVVLNGLTTVEAVHGAYDTVIKYRTASPNEYFIVENRSKLGLDTHLPASGLAIYHCDILGSNEFQSGTAQKHYQCALLQADGHRDLETNENQGDGTDFFASVAGVAASSATNPSTRLWNGADSGLLLSDVGVPDDKIAFRVGSAPSGLLVHAESTTPIAIPDNEPTGITSVLTVDRVGVIKDLTVKVDVTHTYIGDLSIELLSPGGERVTLHGRTGAGTDNLSAAYESSSFPGLKPLVGQSVQGKWALRVRDLEGADTGKLVRWSIDAVIEGAPSVVTLEAKPDLPIPDNDATGVSSTLDVDRTGTVGKLKVSIDIKHTWIGDLRIQLVSPGGRVVVLHGQLGGGTDDLVVTYDSAAPLSPLSGIVGQGVKGTWTLRVADLAAQDVGKLNRWALEITPQ